MAWDIEVTDTFGGEANYCWVKRFTIPSIPQESKRATIRRAKKEAGLTGVKCDTLNIGDSWRLDIRGACIVCFVQWADPEYSFHPENAEKESI